MSYNEYFQFVSCCLLLCTNKEAHTYKNHKSCNILYYRVSLLDYHKISVIFLFSVNFRKVLLLKRYKLKFLYAYSTYNTQSWYKTFSVMDCSRELLERINDYVR